MRTLCINKKKRQYKINIKTAMVKRLVETVRNELDNRSECNVLYCYILELCTL